MKIINNEETPIGIDIASSVKAQAKVRLLVGLPVMAVMAVMVWLWASPFGKTGHVVIAGIAVAYIIYVLTVKVLANRQDLVSSEKLAIATSVFDPLFLSSWLSMMGESSALFMAFYLFTILGNGFRIGPQMMRICQIASIAGLSAVILIAPVWKEHVTIGIAFLVLLVVVPLYATKLLKKLHEARAHAERESRAKTQLLAKVSHELRTPLSGVVAAAQLISVETGEERTSLRADTIMNLSRDLLREIDDLLDSAKYEAKALRLDSALFDLHDLMDRVRLTLTNTAAAKGIRLTVSADHEIRDRIQGDSHYLGRALLNIAGNAVKFTEQGNVDVSATLIETTEEHYQIRFSIKDTGIGIAKEFHQKIFERFTQVSEGTLRKYGGTGLGMSISQEIVNLMGGNIVVESEIGRGSLFRFEIIFPRANKKQPAVAIEEELPVVSGKRVLIADDNATNLTLLKELLERDQHSVRIAHSGKEALDMLSVNDFDVVFLDYNMHDIDGAKVLQLYKFGKVNAAPTYFLTADVTATTAAKLADCGPAGLLHKPVTSDGLRRAIAQIALPGSNNPNNGKNDQRGAHPTLKPVPTQYIDLSVIEELKSISQRPGFLAAVLEDAANDITRNCKSLLEALSEADINRVRDSAHALKGVSASVGAARLTTLAGKLMLINRGDLAQNAERWKLDINDTRDQTVTALHNILHSDKNI